MSELENEEIGPIVGLEVNVANNLYKTVADVKQAGYNFVVTYMVHPQMKGELSAGHSRSYPNFVARSEDSIATNDWAILVASKVSKWIDVDSSVPYVRINSEKALYNEIEYSNYLGIEVVVVPLRSQNCVNLAKCLMKKTPPITHRASQCVWASVPMTESKHDCDRIFNESPQKGAQLDNMKCPWKWWNALRSITHEHKVYLALELTNTSTTIEMRRWYCEPIHALVIHTSLFQTDDNGLPILSSILQTFIKTVWNFNEYVRIVITGSDMHGDIKLYRQHLLHLYKNAYFNDVINISGPRNEDRVQLPIQPLKDVLDVYIYELFEDDAAKYESYQRAICWALLDTVPHNEKNDRRTNILIIGAGRGHMATVVLLAADDVERDVHVVVYESNCNVHPSLHYRKHYSWKDRVEIKDQDIENWDTSEKFDIIILDSVGVAVENELYPENLGKAKKFLKEDGIMIPSSCTKSLAPVSAPRLYLELNSTDRSLKRFETPYLVVSPNRSTLVSALPLFNFKFPSDGEPLDNSRYSILKFKANCDFMLHGFLSFFEAVLYKDIKLSIHPDSYYPEDGEFYSWMPLYFPIRVPIYISESDSIEVHFWRCVNESGDEVWYEWSVAKPLTSAIHNPDGRSHKMT